MRIHSLKIAFVLGLLFALWHLCWAALVYAGPAQRVLDFVFWMHFIVPPDHVEAYDPGRAGLLIGMTGAFAWLPGLAAGKIRNIFHRAS
jgi:hypothetical protein